MDEDTPPAAEGNGRISGEMSPVPEEQLPVTEVNAITLDEKLPIPGLSKTIAETAVLPTSPTQATYYTFWELKSGGYHLVWFVILLVHGFCAYFYCISAIIYKKTPGSSLEMPLTSYDIGMKMDAYPTLERVHLAFGVVHSLMGGLMVLWTLFRRRFLFGPFQEMALKRAMPTSKVVSSQEKSLTLSAGKKDAPPLSNPQLATARTIAAKLFGRMGLFGVESAYFSQMMTIREIVEVVLRVIQAYRMSQYLARPWLNRFFLAILVVHCWGGPLIRTMYHQDTMQRRALSLILDGLLDFLTATGVSAMLMLSLFHDYDPAQGGFPGELWYDATWFANTTTALEILLVSSWSDLGSRIVFSISVLMCLETIKEMVREVPRSSDTSRKPSLTREGRPSQSGPTVRQPSVRLQLVSSFRKVASSTAYRAHQLIHGGLFIVGICVLVLHLHAESIRPVKQCVLHVQPWASRIPACPLIRLNCYENGHVGELARVAQEWGEVHPKYVRQLLVTHCSGLEVPPIIQGFANLKSIKMYNTTIHRWERDAAITGTHHPHLVNYVFGRVNVTSKILPPGLSSPDFPPLLTDMSFAYSNLEDLPDEVATSWPSNAGFGCEVCNFKYIPKGLMKIPEIGWIAFSQNPLQAFPFEMMAIPSLALMLLTGISFPSLDAPDPAALATTDVNELYLQNANVTYLPKWVDFYVSRPRELWFTAPMDLSGSPFCTAINELRAGTRQSLPSEWFQGIAVGHLSDFNYLRADNVSALDGLIECTSEWAIYYPKDDEDRRYSLESA